MFAGERATPVTGGPRGEAATGAGRDAPQERCDSTNDSDPQRILPQEADHSHTTRTHAHAHTCCHCSGKRRSKTNYLSLHFFSCPPDKAKSNQESLWTVHCRHIVVLVVDLTAESVFCREWVEQRAGGRRGLHRRQTARRHQEGVHAAQNVTQKGAAAVFGGKSKRLRNCATGKLLRTNSAMSVDVKKVSLQFESFSPTQLSRCGFLRRPLLPCAKFLVIKKLYETGTSEKSCANCCCRSCSYRKGDFVSAV